MERKEMNEMSKEQGRVDFWGERNEDKQALSMDWSHDAHFWIAVTSDQVDEIIAIVRQFLSDKFGGDWPDRPSPHATGRYLDVRHNHHLFAEYTRKGVKDRFVEVHPAETGRTIFVRFWHDLFEEAKAAFQARGFHYHSRIPDEHQIKVPGQEISPEKAAALEKFRTSQPLKVPETTFERKRSSAPSVVSLVVLVVILAAAAVLLRKPLGQLFVKVEPLNLGNFLAAKSEMAAFEQVDGSIVYALADVKIEDKVKAGVLVYGALIDTSRAGFYAVHKLTDVEGLTLYEAPEGTIISIPSFAEGQDLNKYRAIDAGAFRHDRKKDWENLQGEQVALQGALQKEPDGFYLKVSDGLIRLVTIDQFTLLNLLIAQEKGKLVTLYGTVGETFDWKEVRQETRKMFRFRIDPVSYDAITAS
jgi:hypothetical protein